MTFMIDFLLRSLKLLFSLENCFGSILIGFPFPSLQNTTIDPACASDKEIGSYQIKVVFIGVCV